MVPKNGNTKLTRKTDFIKYVKNDNKTIRNKTSLKMLY